MLLAATGFSMVALVVDVAAGAGPAAMESSVFANVKLQEMAIQINSFETLIMDMGWRFLNRRSMMERI